MANPGNRISAAAQELRNAMKGFGTDEGTLVRVVSGLDPQDIAPLVQAYSKEIGRDLLADIKDETSGNFEDTLVAMLTPQPAYDATLLRKAMKGLGTDENVVCEVICTRTSEELKMVSAEFMRLFGHSLADDLSSELGGDLKKMILRRLQPLENGDIDNDVELLYKAGQGRIGTDESVFVNVIGSRPKEYLVRLNEAYANKHGKSLAAVVESELGGDLKKALTALVKPNPIYFAEKLHVAFAGAGTDEATVIRVIASQRFAKLKAIGAQYLAKYDQSLKDRIRDEMGGDSKKVLAAIVERAVEGK